RLWDAVTGEPVGLPLRHPGEVFEAVFARAGRLIATRGGDAVVRVWDMTPLRPTGAVLPCGQWVGAVAFSPDGTRRVAGTGEFVFGSGGLRLWDVAARQPVGPDPRGGRAVPSAAFHPDGTRFVVGTGHPYHDPGEARVHDAVTGAAVGAPMRH